ncbi:MAG TPA: phosrestin [Candidatus Binatia bacterium]|nr:phosrestin [Candidatus Binatia bacterium]
MRTEEVTADFIQVAWESLATGVRVKVVRRGGLQLRLVQFSREFVEREWCEKKHTGYVIEGELAVEFASGTVRFHQGQGIVLPGGTGGKHKASSVTEVVTLFLVEDV